MFGILALLPSCSFDEGTMTALATHNVTVASRPIQSQVEGSDCILFVMGLPVSGSLVPNLQEAEDQALAQVPEGDAMENVALYLDTMNLILLQTDCFRIKGDVVAIGEGHVATSSAP
jgi:hypothetical protein